MQVTKGTLAHTQNRPRSTRGRGEFGLFGPTGRRRVHYTWYAARAVSPWARTPGGQARVDKYGKPLSCNQLRGQDQSRVWCIRCIPPAPHDSWADPRLGQLDGRALLRAGTRVHSRCDCAHLRLFDCTVRPPVTLASRKSQKFSKTTACSGRPSKKFDTRFRLHMCAHWISDAPV